MVAVGGYGRRELAPESDVDVLLLDGGVKIDEVANRLWYPLWDAGIRLGHSVRTPREAVGLAAKDLDTATALLDARHVAGDEELTRSLAEPARRQWERRGDGAVQILATSVEERHRRAGEVAFLLEPDLKDGRGGLRDVHALAWARAAGADMAPLDAVSDAYEVLLAARVELHRRARRPGDQLFLQEQDAVSDALEYSDADRMMAAVSGAARRIAWASDESWRRAARRGGGRGWLRANKVQRVETSLGVAVEQGEVQLTSDADFADPSLILRVAEAAASAPAAIPTPVLEELAARAAAPTDPWPEPARHALVGLLATGRPAVSVLEALDQFGLLVRLLPEWDAVRHLPQRNAYHRFTVDRHLCEAAANAAALMHNVSRPDLLVVGAWLHDIGKGFPGDHTETGERVVREIASRLGFAPPDVELLVAMVRHHLLLPDVATRRDLDDPSTAAAVAAAVGDVTTLELLAALTEADSLATGPSAWGEWKAGLVADLVTRTTRVLRGQGGGEPPSILTEAHRKLMDAGDLAVRRSGDDLTVVARDRPGLFSRVAGTLALHGLDILSASAGGEDGMAVEVFRVEPVFGDEPDWDRVAADLEHALAGRLAIEARLDERVRTYRSARPQSVEEPETTVVTDNDASMLATVIEVRARDGIGVLYRITRAFADCDVDVRSAKVQTLGQQVVDTFYVRDATGEKIVDPQHLAEIERAVLGSLRRGATSS